MDRIAAMHLMIDRSKEIILHNVIVTNAEPTYAAAQDETHVGVRSKPTSVLVHRERGVYVPHEADQPAVSVSFWCRRCKATDLSSTNQVLTPMLLQLEATGQLSPDATSRVDLPSFEVGGTDGPSASRPNGAARLTTLTCTTASTGPAEASYAFESRMLMYIVTVDGSHLTGRAVHGRSCRNG